jgi:DNA repair protein RadA
MKESDLSLGKIDGVSAGTEDRLVNSGICTVMELAAALPEEIVEVVGGDSQVASTLISSARSYLTKKGFMLGEFVTASEIAKRNKDVSFCSTGSAALDRLLGGGIETKAITEFFGVFGSGKSQICHTASVLCQLPPERGGLGGSAIYIDTEGTFRVNRLSEIAAARGLDQAEVLDRVLYCRAYDVQHLTSVVKSLGLHIRENSARLVVVDSVISLFRSEFIGRETLAERQQKLNGLMHRLHNLAEVYNIAVLITNQVQSTPNTFFGDPNRPTGGHVLGHSSTYRVYLKKSGEERLAAMVDSPYHPYSEAKFVITSAGCSDLDSVE